jgi:integrase
VTIGGRDVYLGKHGTPESRAEYDRLIAEWLATGRRPLVARSNSSADLTINEMLEAYLHHADSYYVKNGQPTSEPANIRLALRPLRRLYGNTLAEEFGPLRLKAVRRAMIEFDLCRNEVNKRVRQIIRAFKWAVGEELVPASTHHGLKAVPGLRRGRADVRESEPVKPVPHALVDAIRPHVSQQVWAMVELQRLTGMRPGEVVIMRTIDIDTSGRVWIYTPESHKTEHHDRERKIHIGPQAQTILKPWLRPELTAYFFQPREAEAERRAELRANRKTKVQPSQRDRRKRQPRKVPRERYTTLTYCQAITRGCDRALPHPTLSAVPERELTDDQMTELKAWRKAHRWHPNQLRHNAGTRLRREFGLDVARAVLGHSSPVVTEVYAELDQAKAAEAMARIG